MNRLKRRLVSVALIAIILTFFMQETVAFYSVIGKATNVVTTGNIRFIIHETTDQGTEFPQEGVYITPGDIVSKKVTIKSDCDQPFYLRLKIVYGIDSKELPAEECFKLNINEENWEFYEGWYYYKGIVEPYETTPQIFSHVEMVGSKINNNYLGKTLTLSVDAQAVQSENNPLANGKYYEVSGWPKGDKK